MYPVYSSRPRSARGPRGLNPDTPEHVSAQSEDQRRRRAKHQLAVDQLECSVFYTSYSETWNFNIIH